MDGTSYVSNWCCQLREKAVVGETVAHEISDEGTLCYNNLQRISDIRQFSTFIIVAPVTESIAPLPSSTF